MIRASLRLAPIALLLIASLAFAQASPAPTRSRTAPARTATTPTSAATSAPAATNTKAAMGAAATDSKAAGVKAGALVDLNSASKEDLMKLPGVGEAISAKIIAGRPWANKLQLLNKSIVNKPAYDKLSALVVAKQAAKK